MKCRNAKIYQTFELYDEIDISLSNCIYPTRRDASVHRFTLASTLSALHIRDNKTESTNLLSYRGEVTFFGLLRNTYSTFYLLYTPTGKA